MTVGEAFILVDIVPLIIGYAIMMIIYWRDKK